jgi:hypothetical protein
MSPTFKEADVKRAIKSARDAGLKVELVEIVTPTGVTIRVSGPRCEATTNVWDEVLTDDQNSQVRSRLDR